jgi:hypothetical protein
MNPWVAIAGFIAWTSAVFYYADQHGHARAEHACQEERNAAAAAQKKEEGEHSAAGKKFEEDRKHDDAFNEDLHQQGRRVATNHPVPAGCSLGAERLRIWNTGNAGPDVSGEPAAEVRDQLPGSAER